MGTCVSTCVRMHTHTVRTHVRIMHTMDNTHVRIHSTHVRTHTSYVRMHVRTHVRMHSTQVRTYARTHTRTYVRLHAYAPGTFQLSQIKNQTLNRVGKPLGTFTKKKNSSFQPRYFSQKSIFFFVFVF